MGNWSSQPEPFVDRPPLSGREALQALERAERLDGYQKQVKESPRNTFARRNYTYMPSLYTVPQEIPQTPWIQGQVLWMDPSADGGLPHTRPPYYICLPADIEKKHIATTLEHERIHLSQRFFTKEWTKLIEVAWDMRPYSGTLPSEILERLRLNPDLLNLPHFIWKKEWVPLCMFESSQPKNLTDAKVKWWNDKTRTLHDSPPGIEFFGHIPSGEHPFEIAAYLLTDPKNTSPARQALDTHLKHDFSGLNTINEPIQ